MWTATFFSRLGRAARAFSSSPETAVDLPGILDLLEEHVYAGEVTRDGHYVSHVSPPTLERFIGTRRATTGEVWESRIHPDDYAAYDAFNRRLLAGHDADAVYRLHGLDGVTRVLHDRARPSRRRDGTVLVRGIISDVTARREADARAAETSDRFARLLDVIGEHVYLAQAHADGRVEEIFQGPGADRLLGGAEPDAAMENWNRAIHADDQAAVDACNARLQAGEDADVEYRLIGADGVTRWVHDRAVARRRPDGIVEISGIVSDVTERRRMRVELDRAHAALTRVIEALDDHLYTLRVEPDGSVVNVYSGPHQEQMIGGEFPPGQPHEVWRSLMHPDDLPRFDATVRGLRDGEPREMEYRIRGVDGVERTVLDRLRPRRQGGQLFFDGITRDVSAWRALEAELRRRAQTDDLTGAFNRRHFAELLGDALRGDRDGCALLLLDADHFKQINDVRGHLAGDAVLVELVARLESALSADDRLARWGGEEFAVLLRGVGDEADLLARAEALRVAVARVPVASVELTVSVGAARASEALDTLDKLVEAADRCLYGAKRDGRNRVALHGAAGFTATVRR